MLSSVDRIAETHAIQFSAQEDRWAMEWKARTGFRLTDFETRWLELRELPPHIANPLLNRDPINRATTPEVNAWLAANPDLSTSDSSIGAFGRAALRGRFGGTQRTYSRYVTGLARCYLASNPGRDGMSSNVRVHSLARRAVERKELSIVQLADLHAAIEYRQSLMRTATWFLIAIGVRAQPCHQWSEDDWKNKFGKERQRYSSILTAIHQAKLYPSPTSSQGIAWHKPANYWAAAFVENNLLPNDVSEALKQMIERKYYVHIAS